jgi:phosphoribosylaminoimidazole (AIR) synthetase
VAANDAADATAQFEAAGETVWTIGAVEAAEGAARVELNGLEF